MKTPTLVIGSLFGIVALATASNLHKINAKVELQVRGDDIEPVGVGVYARDTSLAGVVAAASASTSTIFDTVVSTIISCAPTVVDCPAHLTTQLTLTVPISTASPATQSAAGTTTSTSLSSSTTTARVTFTPPSQSVAPSTAAPSTLLLPASQLSSASLSTSLAAKSGFSASLVLNTTTNGPPTIVWSTAITTPSTFNAHSGFTAIGSSSALGMVESNTVISHSYQTLIESSASTSSVNTVLTPISASGTPLVVSSFRASFSNTSTALGGLTSSDITSTITSIIVATSTFYPSTITLTTITITPSSHSTVSSTSVSSSISLQQSNSISTLPAITTTIKISLAPTTSVETTTTIITSESQVQPSTTTQTEVLSTPLATPITLNSANTYAAQAPTCNCPLASASSVTVTVSVTFFQSSALVTPIPVQGSISSASGSIAPVASCAQDNCLRQFLQSTAVLAFCSSFTTTTHTASTSYPPYVSMCSNGVTQLSSACSCVHGIVPSGPTSSTTVTKVVGPDTSTVFVNPSPTSSTTVTKVVGPDTSTIFVNPPTSTFTANGIATSSICHCPFYGQPVSSNATSSNPECTCTPGETAASSSNDNINSSNSGPSTSTTYSTTYIMPTLTTNASPSSSTFSGEAGMHIVDSSGAFKLAFVVGFAVVVGLVSEL